MESDGIYHRQAPKRSMWREIFVTSETVRFFKIIINNHHNNRHNNHQFISFLELFYRPQRKFGAYVIPSVWGWLCSLYHRSHDWGVCIVGGGLFCFQGDLTPGGSAFKGVELWDMVNKRALRIPLECILVQYMRLKVKCNIPTKESASKSFVGSSIHIKSPSLSLTESYSFLKLIWWLVFMSKTLVLILSYFPIVLIITDRNEVLAKVIFSHSVHTGAGGALIWGGVCSNFLGGVL